MIHALRVLLHKPGHQLLRGLLTHDCITQRLHSCLPPSRIEFLRFIRPRQGGNESGPLVVVAIEDELVLGAERAFVLESFD
jgi:hypothetical protein